MGVHTIHAALLQRQVRVVVVGCGGAGSVLGLWPALSPPGAHRARPSRGLHVTVWMEKRFQQQTACGSPSANRR